MRQPGITGIKFASTRRAFNSHRPAVCSSPFRFSVRVPPPFAGSPGSRSSGFQPRNIATGFNWQVTIATAFSAQPLSTGLLVVSGHRSNRFSGYRALAAATLRRFHSLVLLRHAPPAGRYVCHWPRLPSVAIQFRPLIIAAICPAISARINAAASPVRFRH